MNDFKAGDKVRVVAPGQWFQRIGLVVEAPASGTHPVRVKVAGSFSLCLYRSELVPVTDPSVITIDRADLPEVTVDGGWATVEQPGLVSSIRIASLSSSAQRTQAYQHLAVAEFLEAREKAAEEADIAERLAAEKRDKRRDKLAEELNFAGVMYRHALPSTRRAIDRIIDLENAATQ